MGSPARADNNKVALTVAWLGRCPMLSHLPATPSMSAQPHHAPRTIHTVWGARQQLKVVRGRDGTSTWNNITEPGSAG
ncbi:hypothetical protein GCM10022207_75130 [Streptomyces lannensis]|uniref:Uncharacterized protein n=1 Tax=Streptomyces lannensis TaxID=766498 RepID=A0ABP7L8C5_9ACTN